MDKYQFSEVIFVLSADADYRFNDIRKLLLKNKLFKRIKDNLTKQAMYIAEKIIWDLKFKNVRKITQFLKNENFDNYYFVQKCQNGNDAFIDGAFKDNIFHFNIDYLTREGLI